MTSYISNIFKKITFGVFSCLIAQGLVGCTDELEMPTTPDNSAEAGYITLNVNCSEMTRATEPGIDDLNENRIDRVTLCLWPNGGDWGTAKAPLYTETFYGLDAIGSAKIRVPLTDALVTQLFQADGSKTCNAFVAVNVDAGAAKTVDEIRALAIASDFNNKQKQDNFAMDGEGTIQLSEIGATRAAYGSIDVKRSAAKIDLHLNVAESVQETINGQTLTWTPDFNGMKVVLNNAVSNSQLDPKPADGVAESAYFDTPAELSYTFTTEGSDAASDAKFPHRQTIPFYTYPNVWTDKENEPHRTYMTLMIPWSSDGSTYKTCYYQVPVVPLDCYELVRNTSYHVRLNVSVLGSFVPDEPLELEEDLSYIAADWGTEGINVDIKDFRYLVVDQNEFTVNNENNIQIPFFTSHPCVVTDIKMTFHRFNFSDQGSQFDVTVTRAQNNMSIKKGGGPVFVDEIDNTRKILSLTHDLKVFNPVNAKDEVLTLTRRVNGTRAPIDYPDQIQALLNTIQYYVKSDVDEYSSVEFELTIQHKDVYDGTSGIDKNLYKEKLKITMYPGIYITAIQNYARNLENLDYTEPPLGNTIINGTCAQYTYNLPTSGIWRWGDERRLAYNERNWTNSIGLGFPPNYFNWNPNLYLVTITKLPEGTEYIIGDPRSSNINNYLSNDNVDEKNERVFATEYWYYQAGNNNYGPETNKNFFGGGTNPFYRHYGVNTTYWNEYIIPGFVEAPALGEAKNRTLKYYYPTREADDNMYKIAPKFRICSSYGGTGRYMTRVMSRRRAAAYQELGFCAGRWRLPTFAEVKFVMQLAADQKIPRLFGTNDGPLWFYWCAQGAVRVPNGTVANPKIEIVKNPENEVASAAPFTGDNFRDHTRFVYDEWYWGEAPLIPSSPTPNASRPTYTFTWGDKVISNPQGPKN